MKAILRPAMYWHCPKCGHNNFEFEEPSQMSEEEIAEMKEEYGIPEEEEGLFVENIESVICVGCTEQFDAVYFEE